MEAIKQFIKSWGGYTLMAILGAILVILFIVAECTTSTALMRIIYGIPTLMPAGIILAWLIKKGVAKSKE
jgi:hypothetical protein